MATTNQIRKSDIGTVFRGTIKDQDNAVVDVSGATTKTIILLKPDGTSISKAASFYTDGTDGILKYTTVDGDISMCGKWRIQWYVVIATGEWRTNTITFKVYDNLI